MSKTLHLLPVDPLQQHLSAASNELIYLSESLPENLARQLSVSLINPIPDTALIYHNHRVGRDQCCSAVVQSISNAPVDTVWSVVRRFDNPHAYKCFLRSCEIVCGDGVDVGSLREVQVISGLPAASSTERLDILDDERRVIGFSVLGGEHRLSNYRSITTLHPAEDGKGTVVVESYVVDVPVGNSREETCDFVDTIVRCNLQSLAKLTQRMTKNFSNTLL
ncbi:Abscisic acid receptor PYL5-like protein [Drosera capensis]